MIPQTVMSKTFILYTSLLVFLFTSSVSFSTPTQDSRDKQNEEAHELPIKKGNFITEYVKLKIQKIRHELKKDKLGEPELLQAGHWLVYGILTLLLAILLVGVGLYVLITTDLEIVGTSLVILSILLGMLSISYFGRSIRDWIKQIKRNKARKEKQKATS